jgi:predicted glycoside hydrolase/deacetylase ChbG (UPF0249 family)
MSHANNEGAREALDFGLVTSVSVMMPCAWVPGWIPYMKQHPDVDMGLHLTLTSEYDDYRWGPVAGKKQVPGLADEQGCLPDSVGLVVANATPDEVESEIRAQIDRAQTMGLPITHLDSHMGTLFRPEFIERYVKVGIEKQIPVLMVSRAGPIAEKVWDAGLPVIDHIHGDSYDWKTTDIDEKVQLYVDALRNLKPGITEMIIHCTKPNDMIGIINGNRDFLYGDYFAMIDPRTKAAIEEEGIILTTWKELKKRRDNVTSE